MRSHKQKPLKDSVLSIRITSEHKIRLREIEQQTRITSSILMTECIEAVYTCLKKYGEFSMPFSIISTRKLDSLKIAQD